jgi:hypothetical protein
MNNERIKELSKQAWEWAEQQEYKDATQEFSEILEQKFAELIVRECADISNQAEKQCQHPGTMMKNHFGVE